VLTMDTICMIRGTAIGYMCYSNLLLSKCSVSCVPKCSCADAFSLKLELVVLRFKEVSRLAIHLHRPQVLLLHSSLDILALLDLMPPKYKNEQQRREARLTSKRRCYER
jgi:hypothetical protein